MKKWIKPLLVVTLVLIVAVTARSLGFTAQIADFRQWVVAQGVMGPIIFAGLYALATVFVVPASALTVMAGVIFGSFIGVSTVMVGATLGASLCFLISRYFARNWILSLLSTNENFQKLDALTEKNGAIIVAITRLVPLFPFTLLNYGFGLTKVSFRIYLFWSVLTILPGTILYVVGIDVVTMAVCNGEVPWVLLVVLCLVVALLAILVRQAKSKLED